MKKKAGLKIITGYANNLLSQISAAGFGTGF